MGGSLHVLAEPVTVTVAVLVLGISDIPTASMACQRGHQEADSIRMRTW